MEVIISAIIITMIKNNISKSFNTLILPNRDTFLNVC